jgi:hypothetical protein
MTYSIPNLHPDWITDRLPTEADADSDGDVLIPQGIEGAEEGPDSGCFHYYHYSLIVPGQPWWSKKAAAANPTPPATSPAPAPTRKVVQIVATAESKNCYSCLYALCNDDSIFEIAFRPGIPDVWRQLPPIPQPE